MSKTIKLKFNADAFYNGNCVYKKDEIAEVETALGWADRWIKRGAEVVTETPAAAPTPQPAKPVEPKTPPPQQKSTNKQGSKKEPKPESETNVDVEL